MPAGEKVLKGTWAMTLKRLSDGTPSKYKARFCVRGDLQTEGVDYFETYAPVFQWSTVRLVLTMILSHGWQTKQVDYTNAFYRAESKKETYIESPKGFGRADKIPKVLRLIKSLYGLKIDPNFFLTNLELDYLKEILYSLRLINPCL